MNTLRNALATMALGLAATCASGAPIDAPPTKTVSFAELDVTNSDGANKLFRRLRAAAKEVCSSLDGKMTAQRSRYRACVDTALANAVESVNLPLVYVAAEAAGVKPIRVAAR